MFLSKKIIVLYGMIISSFIMPSDNNYQTNTESVQKPWLETWDDWQDTDENNLTTKSLQISQNLLPDIYEESVTLSTERLPSIIDSKLMNPDQSLTKQIKCEIVSAVEKLNPQLLLEIVSDLDAKKVANFIKHCTLYSNDLGLKSNSFQVKNNYLTRTVYPSRGLNQGDKNYTLLHAVADWRFYNCLSHAVADWRFYNCLSKESSTIRSESDVMTIIKFLIDCGVNIDAKYVGKTAMHLAAQNNDLLTMTVLVKHGLDINSPDDYGNTPLYLASTGRYFSPDPNIQAEIIKLGTKNEACSIS